MISRTTPMPYWTFTVRHILLSGKTTEDVFRFPGNVPVDRFHIMKNLNEAVMKARRTIQKHADEATQPILKGGRWLLAKKAGDLTEAERQHLAAMLAAPELKQCYELNEDFRQWFKQAVDRLTADQQLADWLARVEASGLKALQAFTRTLRHWREHILNYVEGRHSSGHSGRRAGDIGGGLGRFLQLWLSAIS